MVSGFDFKLNVSKAPCVKALIPFCSGIAIAYFLTVEQIAVHYGFVYLTGFFTNSLSCKEQREELSGFRLPFSLFSPVWNPNDVQSPTDVG